MDQDHLLGPPDAELTLVEYGSYACPKCHAVHEVTRPKPPDGSGNICFGIRLVAIRRGWPPVAGQLQRPKSRAGVADDQEDEARRL